MVDFGLGSGAAAVEATPGNLGMCSIVEYARARANYVRTPDCALQLNEKRSTSEFNEH
jgi:hypothetical protein